jgi:hypothetical protein
MQITRLIISIAAALIMTLIAGIIFHVILKIDNYLITYLVGFWSGSVFSTVWIYSKEHHGKN